MLQSSECPVKLIRFCNFDEPTVTIFKEEIYRQFPIEKVKKAEKQMSVSKISIEKQAKKQGAKNDKKKKEPEKTDAEVDIDSLSPETKFEDALFKKIKNAKKKLR